jgi:hypothetical protein
LTELKVSQSSQSSCKREFTCYLTHLCMERGSNLIRVYSLKSYSLVASYVPPSIDSLNAPTVLLLEPNHM